MTKLREQHVRSIVHSLENGITQQRLADTFGVSVGAITAINTGRSWRSVTGGRIQLSPKNVARRNAALAEEKAVRDRQWDEIIGRTQT